MLSHNFWQQRFGADNKIIGSAITLDGNDYVVVGVMPPGLYPSGATSGGIMTLDEAQQFWIPLSFTAERAAVRNSHTLGVFGRLKANTTLEQAQAELNTLAERLQREYPVNQGRGIVAGVLMNELVGDVKLALWVLLGAVGLVLLIACSNIAGLLLAQQAARSKEIAIRAALGAGRSRLVRQFIAEGLLLSVGGAVGGILLAQALIALTIKITPPQIPRFNEAILDLRVLGFALLLTFGTCLFFGLLPAWRARRLDLQVVLEQGGRSSGPNAGRQKFRQALVVFQLAIAITLAVGSGLLIKSFWRLKQVDPGFAPDNLATMNILAGKKYAEPPQIINFYDSLLDRISGLPGVVSASIAYDRPLQTNWNNEVHVAGRPEANDSEKLISNFNPVSADYFRTIRAQLIEGREFTRQDDLTHPNVTIVNDAFVRRYFPNERALNQRIIVPQSVNTGQSSNQLTLEIVGIVADVKSGALSVAAEPTYYVPAAQAPLRDMSLIVRTQNDAASLIPTIRRTVFELDPNQAVANATTMDTVVADSMVQPRLNMFLMGLFGSLAVILSAVGIYGLFSYAMAQRTQEIGIRMALGARLADVMGMVIKQGLLLAFIGEALGLFGAIAFSRVLKSLLYGVTTTDPVVFISVCVGLTTVALVACYVPARRAVKIDPLVALRNE